MPLCSCFTLGECYLSVVALSARVIDLGQMQFSDFDYAHRNRDDDPDPGLPASRLCFADLLVCGNAGDETVHRSPHGLPGYT